MRTNAPEIYSSRIFVLPIERANRMKKPFFGLLSYLAPLAHIQQVQQSKPTPKSNNILLLFAILQIGLCHGVQGVEGSNPFIPTRRLINPIE